MKHDSKKGESLASWYHAEFALLYVFAALWHCKATIEHWNRMEE